ncbi:hypothetical protein L596_025059 [Steinernema carpocapsae]|uniref:Uncharacterized protein n=1 Tax=Steinernema carpocapsae TaxID=34508 RepID=A0A4U5M6P3_STECR|nr:hypothetical protein L596_025059 [Steinernema carpocapsae]
MTHATQVTHSSPLSVITNLCLPTMGAPLYCALLFLLMNNLVQAETWGEKINHDFNLAREFQVSTIYGISTLGFMHPPIQKMITEVEKGNLLNFTIAFNEIKKEILEDNVPLPKLGKYSILQHLIFKLNGTESLKIIENTLTAMLPNVTYDDITFMKLLTITDEMLEALILHDNYRISYALWHYMHMREGLGKSRTVIRNALPNCEKLAQVPEVREFYKKNKGQEPTSSRVLKDFLDLLKWLDFKNKLSHITY